MYKLDEDKYLLVSLMQPLLHLKKGTGCRKTSLKNFHLNYAVKSFQKKKRMNFVN